MISVTFLTSCRGLSGFLGSLPACESIIERSALERARPRTSGDEPAFSLSFLFPFASFFFFFFFLSFSAAARQLETSSSKTRRASFW